MVNKLEEEPRKYTALELDLARHEGYKIAEELYSLQIKKLKERVKQLENETKYI